jgi:hypothetical protein
VFYLVILIPDAARSSGDVITTVLQLAFNLYQYSLIPHPQVHCIGKNIFMLFCNKIFFSPLRNLQDFFSTIKVCSVIINWLGRRIICQTMSYIQLT